MKKERKRPSSYEAIRREVTILVLALWLICMMLITGAAAVDMRHQLQYLAADAVSYSQSLHHGTNYNEYQLISSLGHHYTGTSIEPLGFFMMKQRPSSLSGDSLLWGNWKLIYGYEPAMLITGITNEDDPREFRFGDSDYLLFTYMEEYSILQQHMVGCGYIDLGVLAEEPNAFIDHVNDHSKADGSIDPNATWGALRMTGWFEGAQFHPVTIDIDENDGDMWSLKWSRMLTLPAEEGKELVQIYVSSPERIGYERNPFTMDGVAYDSLTDFLDGYSGYNDIYGNLFHTVVAAIRRHNTTYADYTVVVAYRCSPMGYAALRLIPFYLISLCLVLIILKAILRRIRKNLVKPLEELLYAASRQAPLKPGAEWKEIYELEEQYIQQQQVLSEKNTELQQLRTKLYYAQNAEENRRQLVSGLTHELKTPLAVIHSYAEGLKDGIAEEKEDHYLSVILEQSEKMDSMVLQMLDLSRLEAGKVRLSSDNFSLLELTKTVVDRFSPMLEEKGLSVSFGVAQEFLITADQARIEQVITNLVSNALKYTEPENQISISVFQHNGKAGFSIENPGKWLPEEALEKVWDSFFRVDPSRTAPGTGLGLAVVKQIIQLHQGSCKAHNTLYKNQDGTFPGVQFSFQIPMG